MSERQETRIFYSKTTNGCSQQNYKSRCLYFVIFIRSIHLSCRIADVAKQVVEKLFDIWCRTVAFAKVIKR